MKCPVCSRENFDPNNFCYNCGYCLNSSLKSVKRMKRDKTTFIAVIILLALICLGLVGVIVYYGNQYRILISDNKELAADYEEITADYDELQEKYDALDSMVYIPDDWNYVYHRKDCTAYDHDIACYVMDEATAIERGCIPCPECID